MSEVTSATLLYESTAQDTFNLQETILFNSGVYIYFLSYHTIQTDTFAHIQHAHTSPRPTYTSCTHCILLLSGEKHKLTLLSPSLLSLLHILSSVIVAVPSNSPALLLRSHSTHLIILWPTRTLVFTVGPCFWTVLHMTHTHTLQAGRWGLVSREGYVPRGCVFDFKWTIINKTLKVFQLDRSRSTQFMTLPFIICFFFCFTFRSLYLFDQYSLISPVCQTSLLIIQWVLSPTHRESTTPGYQNTDLPQ